MKKLLAMVLLSAVSIFAQNAEPTDLKLTETEVLKWEKYQLLAERLNTRYKIDEYNTELNAIKKLLTDLNLQVCSARKLGPQECQPDFQAKVPTVKKLEQAAKK